MMVTDSYLEALEEVPNTTDFRHAGGGAPCSACGLLNQDHPIVRVANTWGPLLLHRLCDGSYVKL